MVTSGDIRSRGGSVPIQPPRPSQWQTTQFLQYDGRIDPAVSANFSEYNNPEVNRLIDRALAEPDQARRAALWGQIDQRIMRNAPLVPLLWENHSFHWASRVHGWMYDPWTATTDLTAPWLDPPNP